MKALSAMVSDPHGARVKPPAHRRPVEGLLFGNGAEARPAGADWASFAEATDVGWGSPRVPPVGTPG